MVWTASFQLAAFLFVSLDKLQRQVYNAETMKNIIIALILCSWAHGLVGMDPKQSKQPKSSLTKPKPGIHQSLRNWHPSKASGYCGYSSGPYTFLGASQNRKPVLKSQRKKPLPSPASQSLQLSKSSPPPAVPKKIPGVLGSEDEDTSGIEKYLTPEDVECLENAFALLDEDGNQGKQKLILAAALKDAYLTDSDDDSPDLESHCSDEEDPENPLGDNYFAQADDHATSSPPENASFEDFFNLADEDYT